MTISDSPELDSFAIVIAGNLNPAIFHPNWMRSMDLISEEEAELAIKSLPCVSSDVTSLDIKAGAGEPSALNLHVLPERLELTSEDVTQLARGLDMIKNLLEILSHTPVVGIGVHRNHHYRMASFEEWDKLGHLLAPKTLLWEDLMERPGMRSLQIESPHKVFNATQIVTIEPSRRLKDGQGVFVSSSFTFDVSKQPAQEMFSTALRAAEWLSESWDYAHSINDAVVKKLRTIPV